MGSTQPDISKHIAGIELYRGFQQFASFDIVLPVKSIQMEVAPDPVAPGLEVVCGFCIGAGLLSVG